MLRYGAGQVKFDLPIRSASSFSSVVKSGIASPHLLWRIFTLAATAELSDRDWLVTGH